MEFFEKDTEHIKYLDTLSGKFSYRSRILMIILLLSGMGCATIFVKHGILISLFIIIGVLLLLLLLAMHIPCSYSADESGFSIMSGLISRDFSYSDVISVAVENRTCGHRRNGGTVYENVLIVSTNKGTYRFHENCGTVVRKSFMYGPFSDQVEGGHAELVRLREFIKTRI